MRQTKQNGRKRFRKKLTRRLRKKRAMKGGIPEFLKSKEQKAQEAEDKRLQEESKLTKLQAQEEARLKKQEKKEAKKEVKIQKNRNAAEAAEIIDNEGNINEEKLKSFMSKNSISSKKLALLKIINYLIDNENVRDYFQKIFDLIDEFNNLSEQTVESSEQTVESSDETVKTVYSNIVLLIGTYDELNKDNNALSLAQQFILKLYKIPNNMLQQPDTQPETNEKYQVSEIIQDPYIRLFLKNILIFQNKKECDECNKRNPQNPSFCDKTCKF